VETFADLLWEALAYLVTAVAVLEAQLVLGMQVQALVVVMVALEVQETMARQIQAEAVVLLQVLAYLHTLVVRVVVVTLGLRTGHKENR
jgi:hypothetical protein